MQKMTFSTENIMNNTNNLLIGPHKKIQIHCGNGWILLEQHCVKLIYFTVLNFTTFLVQFTESIQAFLKTAEYTRI